MTGRGLTLILVTAGMLAAACGRDAVTVAAADVGTTCTSRGEVARRLSDYVVEGRARGELRWLQVRAREQVARKAQTGDGQPRDTVSLTDAARLNGKAAPLSLTMTRRTVDEVLSELDRGAEVVVIDDDAPLTRVAASIRDDGSVAFLGECARERFTAAFDRFAAHRRTLGDERTPAAILTAMATDRTLATAFANYDSPEPGRRAWGDVDPQRRVIDPGGTMPPPPDVAADLRPHMVQFVWPREWASFEGSVAGYVPGVGWNVALPFDAAAPAVLTYTSLTKPLEIWALDRNGTIAAPLARLAVIQPERLASLDDVTLRARVSATSYDDLLRQARAGASVFEVA